MARVARGLRLVLGGFVLSTLLSGCDPITGIFGGACVLGGAAAEERGVSGFAGDTVIRTKINARMLAENAELFNLIGLSIHSGRVLLTGVVKDAATKAQAEAIVHKVSGIREVINEIQIGNPETVGDFVRDSKITGILRKALLLDGRIQGRNYSIRTVDRVIYLIGVAQDQAELDAAIDHAREISGVRDIVSYVVLKERMSKD